MAPKAQTQKAQPKTSHSHTGAKHLQLAKSAPAKQAAADSQNGLTPALGKAEDASPMTPKNFRNHPDMENFFRFIYENDLRLEGLQIIDEIILTRKTKRKKQEA